MPDFLAELRTGSAALHRLTVAADEFRAVLATPHPEVLGWVSDYFADSWPVRPGTAAGTEVYALIDDREYDRLRDWTERVGDPATTYLLRPGHAATAAGTRYVSCRDQRAVYARTDGGVLGVVCPDARSARFAALRVVRDALTAELEGAGWVQFHGAGVERDGRTVLVLGDKGAGKTACALGLVASGRSRLLANDRVMIRDEPAGTALLPWPTPVNVGLGLLAAMSWLPDLHRRYRSGVDQPPNQPAEITAALLEGRSEPMYDDVGRELKCEIMPDQLRDWFRVGAAGRGTLELVLFPRVDLSLDRAGPPEPATNRAGPGDLMPPPGRTDIFPDFLGLRPAEVARGRRRRVERALAAVRRSRAATVRLGREFGVPDVL